MEEFAGLEALVGILGVVGLIMKYLFVLIYILGSLHVLQGTGEKSLLMKIRKSIVYWVGSLPLLGVLLYPYSGGIDALIELGYAAVGLLMWSVIFLVFIIQKNDKNIPTNT